jgi:hypothetical protein
MPGLRPQRRPASVEEEVDDTAEASQYISSTTPTHHHQ